MLGSSCNSTRWRSRFNSARSRRCCVARSTASASASIDTGLITKSYAPARIAPIAPSRLPKAVITTTQMSVRSASMRSQSSRPLVPARDGCRPTRRRSPRVRGARALPLRRCAIRLRSLASRAPRLRAHTCLGRHRPREYRAVITLPPTGVRTWARGWDSQNESIFRCAESTIRAAACLTYVNY